MPNRSCKREITSAPGNAGLQATPAPHQRSRVRVLVAEAASDERQQLVEPIKQRPEIELVGCTGYGNQAFALFRGLQPDVALLGAQLQGAPVTDLIDRLKREKPGCLVVALAHNSEPGLRERCISAGADNFLTRQRNSKPLLSRRFSTQTT